MSGYETLKLGIKRWINEQAYLTAIFAENSNVRPSRLPYVTVRFDTQNSLGLHDEQKDISDDGIVEVRGHRTLTVGIDVYGETSISKMEELKNSLGKVTVINMLDDEYGIAIIDIIQGIDWIRARMQENIFQKLVNADKIPYTDAGVAIIEAQTRATLENAIKKGVIAPDPDKFDGEPYLVQVPKVADVSANDKGNRLLPDITWQATLAGAIHRVTIQGRVEI